MPDCLYLPGTSETHDCISLRPGVPGSWEIRSHERKESGHNAEELVREISLLSPHEGNEMKDFVGISKLLIN